MEDDEAGDDHRRTTGLDARHGEPLLERHCGEPLELGFGRGSRHAVAVRTHRVVLGVAEVKRGERRHGARYADRGARLERREERADVARPPRPAPGGTAGPSRGSAR